MKLAHVAIVSPRRAGLYETTRELVAAECALGHDARMYDPAPTIYHPKGDDDRGAPIERDKDWLAEADVIVDHSGCDGSTDGLDKPHILVAHGRPKHSFIGEVQGRGPVYSYHQRIDRDERYRAVVTFWSEHVPYHQVVFQKTPVKFVPPCVDLDAWTPNGPKVNVFNGKGGEHNVVLTDMWRDDGDMFDAVNAVALAHRQLGGIKLHIFGMTDKSKGWRNFLGMLNAQGVLGHVQGWANDLGHVYRAADLLVSAHSIDTRAVREAMACGCPVVRADDGIDSTAKRIQRVLPRCQLDRSMVRSEAEYCFNPANTAESFLSVVEEAVPCCT